VIPITIIWPTLKEETQRKELTLTFLCATISGTKEPIADNLKNLEISLEQCEQ
jgi:hypothetical protein